MSTKLSRRRFLLFAGVGVAIVGGAALAWREVGKLVQGNSATFRAVAGLPREPLPAYASYVIEGRVALDAPGSKLTLSVVAGAPAARRPIPLLTRTASVTSMQQVDGAYHITAAYDASTQLQPGEASTFTITLDPSHQLAQASFFSSPIQMDLERWSEPS